MEQEQALQVLHETLPRDVGFSVRYAQTTHSREDFLQRPPVRTGDYRSEESWAVTLQCHRGARYYLETTIKRTVGDAVSSAVEQFRAWERQDEASKPPKQLAPSRAQLKVDQQQQQQQREAM